MKDIYKIIKLICLIERLNFKNKQYNNMQIQRNFKENDFILGTKYFFNNININKFINKSKKYL